MGCSELDLGLSGWWLMVQGNKDTKLEADFLASLRMQRLLIGITFLVQVLHTKVKLSLSWQAPFQGL